MDGLFPHEQVRDVQRSLMDDIGKALRDGRHFVAHAPTGLGKTAAALSPALGLALQRDLAVFFLTSRHTQHKMVLDTLRAIKQKHNVSFLATSIIGKKWMCAQENVATMRSSDFFAYCQALRDGGKCDYHSNVQDKKNLRRDAVLSGLERNAPLPTEDVVQQAMAAGLCPYELSLMLAKGSKVIVADYYYLLHPDIRKMFLGKIDRKLGQAIIVFDEGHNLPARAREMLTQRVSARIIAAAVREAREYHFSDLVLLLSELGSLLERLSGSLKDNGEKLVPGQALLDGIAAFADIDRFTKMLEAAAETVRESRQKSSIGTVAEFLAAWPDGDDGFSRILKRDGKNILLSRRCLDPALATQELFSHAYGSVTMSGTLSPVQMFADLLGIPAFRRVAKEYPSPFPRENRLALVVPQTTTRFTHRSEEQFRAIACQCAKIANSISGCIALFFPSYSIRNSVNRYFAGLYKRTLFLEQQGMTKEQKQEFLQRFVRHSQSGAALLAAASGSFGEGIDLPGTLKGVIVVGLPLDRPDIESQQLIDYYDKKFGKGWEYGYTMPALTRTMQNAGRCIRSEKDRGVIVLLDERYAWPRYFKAFPAEWHLKVCPEPVAEIQKFFAKN